MRRVTFGIIVLAVGIATLLNTMEIIDLKWFFDQEWKKYIVPVLIIFLGLRLIISRSSHGGLTSVEIPQTDGNEMPRLSALMSGNDYNYNSQPFHGAKVDVCLGGIKLGLDKAIIEDDCTIEANAFCGGIEIVVPSDVNIIIESRCFLGGVNNNVKRATNPESHTIVVKASCFFGGIDIK